MTFDPAAFLARMGVATDAAAGRVIVSSVWAYRAPIRSWRGGATPGAGVFRVEPPPFDPLRRPWEAMAPARLVELEAEALALGEAWLLAALG